MARLRFSGCGHDASAGYGRVPGPLPPGRHANEALDVSSIETAHRARFASTPIEANAQSDSESAQRLAHSLKGPTGTIGAVRRTTILSERESTIGAGRDDVGATLAAVSEELDRAVSTLRRLFAEV
jgi:HPt (histidine-containing phosphotransfer) domain-containing protein